MKKTCLIVLSVIAGVMLLGCLHIFSYEWVILPVNSTPHRLTLVASDIRYAKIVIRHYADHDEDGEVLVDETVTLWGQDPAAYLLPKVTDGRIEISVDSFLMEYPAKELYDRGLLVYVGYDYDLRQYNPYQLNSYTHFISGREKVSFVRDRVTKEYVRDDDAPSPNMIDRRFHSVISR